MEKMIFFEKSCSPWELHSAVT